MPGSPSAGAGARTSAAGRRPACSGMILPTYCGGLIDGATRLSLRGRAIHHLIGVSCFAEKCAASERSLIKIDSDVPPEIAAVTGCAVVTGVGAALNLRRTPP